MWFDWIWLDLIALDLIWFDLNVVLLNEKLKCCCVCCKLVMLLSFLLNCINCWSLFVVCFVCIRIHLIVKCVLCVQFFWFVLFCLGIILSVIWTTFLSPTKRTGSLLLILFPSVRQLLLQMSALFVTRELRCLRARLPLSTSSTTCSEPWDCSRCINWNRIWIWIWDLLLLLNWTFYKCLTNWI